MALAFLCSNIKAQDGANQKIDFEKYDPVSTLVVPEHKPLASKFPFIDVHNHQWDMPTKNLSELICPVLDILR